MTQFFVKKAATSGGHGDKNSFPVCRWTSQTVAIWTEDLFCLHFQVAHTNITILNETGNRSRVVEPEVWQTNGLSMMSVLRESVVAVTQTTCSMYANGVRSASPRSPLGNIRLSTNMIRLKEMDQKEMRHCLRELSQRLVCGHVHIYHCYQFMEQEGENIWRHTVSTAKLHISQTALFQTFDLEAQWHLRLS